MWAPRCSPQAYCSRRSLPASATGEVWLHISSDFFLLLLLKHHCMPDLHLFTPYCIMCNRIVWFSHCAINTIWNSCFDAPYVWKSHAICTRKARELHQYLSPGLQNYPGIMFTVTACGHVRGCRCLPHSATYSLLPCITITSDIKALETAYDMTMVPPVTSELHFL